MSEPGKPHATNANPTGQIGNNGGRNPVEPGHAEQRDRAALKPKVGLRAAVVRLMRGLKVRHG